MVNSYKILLAALFSSFALTSETYTVNSGSYYYTPANLTISVGDMVEFVNDGGYHDVEVTSGPELLSLPPCSGPCTIGTLTFNLAGTYDYICSIGSHASNGMVGTITVEETNTTSTSVQVIHNSASPTVDVYIDGVLSVEGFAYRAATPVLDLGTDFTVGIAPAGGDVIANFPFNLEDGGEYVVVATGILNDDTAPFNLAATSTMFGATDGNVGLNVYHGSTDAPSVDVLADGSVLVSDLMYGEFSGFVEVAAADYTIGIAPTGGTSIADFTAPLSGLGGESAVVFASGFLTPGDSDPSFGLFAALEDGSVLELSTYVGSTSVQVIHNSASPTVDVYIDGVLSVEGFAYRTATPVLDLGTDFTVGIAPAGGDVIANFPFNLEDGGEYVVVATGILNDDTAPFNLAATSTMFGATDGNVGLNVYHGSTDAPSVDVLADGSVLVSDLMYGEFSGFVEVAAADYTIGIAPTGGTSIADFTAPLSGLGGESAVVFASGFLTPGDSDPGFGLFAALEDGSVLELSSSELSVEILANPASFGLTSVYPNPFNPATSINYNVNKFSKVNINIYDVTGKLVSILENSYKPVGNHSIVWKASSLPSGVYFVNLSINSHTETIKIMLTK